MTAEIIKEIKQAELAAEERIKAAQQEAKEIVAKAEAEAVRIIREAEEAALLKGRKQLEEAEKEANMEADSKRKKNDELCRELRNKAAAKMEDAVNLVMERIVKINGNS